MKDSDYPSHEWTTCPKCGVAHWWGWGSCRKCGYGWSKVEQARLDHRDRLRAYQNRVIERNWPTNKKDPPA